MRDRDKACGREMVKELMFRKAAERYVNCMQDCRVCQDSFSPGQFVCPVYVERYCHRKGAPVPIGREVIVEGIVVDRIYL
jgi:hypothetical protein